MVDTGYFFDYKWVMRTEATEKRGRPTGRDYGVVRSMRLTEQDLEILKDLSESWGCSEPAVVRRLLREAAARKAASAVD